jgi:UDP-N-acetylglucosamine 2-epimerase (non-hydrolysing)
LRPETVIKIGSTMWEVLAHYAANIERSDVLNRLQLEPREYFVVSAHREENVDCRHRLGELLETLNAVAARYRRPIIVSLHPRTRQRIEARDDAWNLDPLIRLCKPFGFFDYVKLQKHASCVLSDSGTLTEESSLLGFPAVMLRQAHERPEGMDVGTLVMSGLRRERVLQGIELVTSQRLVSPQASAIPPDYQAECVSRKVVRIIHSYVDYVNRTVWSKPDADTADRPDFGDRAGCTTPCELGTPAGREGGGADVPGASLAPLRS